MTKRDRALGGTPAAAIRDDVPFIEQAKDNWLMARRAVNALEKVIGDDDIWPLIPQDNLMKARRVIADFYQQEES